MKIWEFKYNHMTWESSYRTMSLHQSEEGARAAMMAHKEEFMKEWDRLYPTKDDEPYPIEEFHDWMISEVDVHP